MIVTAFPNPLSEVTAVGQQAPEAFHVSIVVMQCVGFGKLCFMAVWCHQRDLGFLCIILIAEATVAAAVFFCITARGSLGPSWLSSRVLTHHSWLLWQHCYVGRERQSRIVAIVDGASVALSLRVFVVGDFPGLWTGRLLLETLHFYSCGLTPQANQLLIRGSRRILGTTSLSHPMTSLLHKRTSYRSIPTLVVSSCQPKPTCVILLPRAATANHSKPNKLLALAAHMIGGTFIGIISFKLADTYSGLWVIYGSWSKPRHTRTDTKRQAP